MKRKPAIRPVGEAAASTMKNMSSKDALGANLHALMASTPGKTTSEELERYCKGTSKRTIDNMKSGTYDPFFYLDDVASALGLQGWFLICPLALDELGDILSVFSDTNDTGRELIRLAVDAARKIRKDGDNPR